MTITWHCPKCKSEHIRFMGPLTIAAPMECWSNLPKKSIQKKEIQIWGMGWMFSDVYCMDCGYSLYTPGEAADWLILSNALQRIAMGDCPNPVEVAKEALEDVAEQAKAQVTETFKGDE